MGRLIDAGLVLDNLSGRLESMKDYDAVKDVINNMPTAYDVDKVVEQLEAYSNADEAERLGTMPVVELADAIKIVKGGGSRVTSTELCEMCTEYSATEKCEYKNTCELQKILSENKDLKAENKQLKEKIEELENERSWRDFPDMMGK